MYFLKNNTRLGGNKTKRKKEIMTTFTQKGKKEASLKNISIGDTDNGKLSQLCLEGQCFRKFPFLKDKQRTISLFPTTSWLINSYMIIEYSHAGMQQTHSKLDEKHSKKMGLKSLYRNKLGLKVKSNKISMNKILLE